MEKDLPPGYCLPLYRSLTEIILLAGAPRGVIVINAGAAFWELLIIQMPWLLPINVIVYFAARCLTKKDDQFFDCLKMFFKKRDYYST